jgi:hypothetical protein
LLASGDYRLASLEYERIISATTEAKALNPLRYQRARCFKLLGEYSRAQVELSKVSYWALPDSMVAVYKYEEALCDYLAGSFSNVIFQTDQIDSSSLTNDLKVNITLLRALSYNELMEWDKALDAALLYNRSVHSSPLADSIETLLTGYYQPKKLPRLKSEKKANIYRMVPGLGQAYAGRPIEGLFNFSLNAAFLSFGVYQIWNHYYITGYFVGALGLNKVYFGGHARTAYLLNKHNYKVRKDFCEKVKSALLCK